MIAIGEAIGNPPRHQQVIQERNEEGDHNAGNDARIEGSSHAEHNPDPDERQRPEQQPDAEPLRKLRHLRRFEGDHRQQVIDGRPEDTGGEGDDHASTMYLKTISDAPTVR